MIIEQLKICSKCREEKSVSEFYTRNKSPDGLQLHCKSCGKEAVKKWDKDNPELAKNRMSRWYNRNKKRLQKEYAEKKR